MEKERPTSSIPEMMSDTEKEKKPTPSPPPTITTPDSEAHEEVNPDHLTGIKLVITLSSLTLVGFLILLDVSIVTTAIPSITSHFHSLNDVGWYGSAYLLASCALQPLTGKIYGEFDRKWSIISFIALFELGSAICGAATSSNMLIVGRAIAGMGSSGILNGGYSIIHAIAPLPKQPLLLGILIGFAQIGVLSGPLIGGVLTQYVTWRWCFYINLPIGGLAVPLLFFVTIPSNKKTEGETMIDRILKLDLIGFFFFAPAAIQLVLALEWGGTKFAWSSSTVIGLFCGTFGTTLVFVAWEYHMGKKAMIPLAIIRRLVIWSSCAFMAFFMGSMLSATYYLPVYFQSVRNAKPTLSGVDLLPLILSTVLFTIVGGVLVQRVGYYLPFAVACGVLVTLGSGLASTLTPTTKIGTWIGYQIIMGAGRGVGFQIPLIAVQNNSEKDEVSIVNALVVFSQNLGGAVFLAMDQVIFSSSLKHYLMHYVPDIDPQAVINAGAVSIRKVVSAESLPGVLLAYSKSINRVMYFATGISAGSLFLSFGMRWMSIKKKPQDKKPEVLTTDSEAADDGSSRV